MLHGLISLLTVAALLVHSLGSCCAQHRGADCCTAGASGQGRGSEGCSHKTGECSHTATTKCRHAHGRTVSRTTEHQDGEKPRCPHGPNHEGRCQFLATGKVDVPASDVRLTFDEGLTSVVTLDAGLRLTPERRGRISSSGLPPDRHVRDVTQVWLI